MRGFKYPTAARHFNLTAYTHAKKSKEEKDFQDVWFSYLDFLTGQGRFANQEGRSHLAIYRKITKNLTICEVLCYKEMTAIRTNKTWIKFVVVIFLVVIGVAGIYYAYITYFHPPNIEDGTDEEVVPDSPETVYLNDYFPVESNL